MMYDTIMTCLCVIFAVGYIVAGVYTAKKHYDHDKNNGDRYLIPGGHKTPPVLTLK